MKLSDPIQIKNCRFANRAVMAPMVPNSAGPDGSVTKEYENFYLARARSKVGYLVLGAAVKLFEKQTELGGSVNLGKKPPFKESLQDLVDFLVKQTRNAGVSVSTGEEVTAERVRALMPEHIIIATGACEIPLAINGLNDHPAKFAATDILRWEIIPPGIYLIIGGGAVGLELAEYLADSTRKVTVIEMTGQVGRGLHATRLNLIIERLASAGVRILKETTLTAVIGNRVEVKTADQKQILDSFDCIVSAVGYRRNTELAEAIRDDIPTTVIGDALEPGTIFEAIRDGFEAAAGLQI